MCGVIAAVGIDPAVTLARGAEALRAIIHRGPDDEGVWTDGRAWLGNRRLAIIDLTSDGHQPMVDPSSGVVITFNGEIYNYLELRSNLSTLGHRFRTQSDTEVLLVAYLEWGEDCLTRLNGMWSFVVWDPRSEQAFFARDRLGVKPLYYTLARGGLTIASEPKALLALYPELRRVNGEAIYRFLANGELYSGDASFYADVSILQGGHCGTFNLGAVAPVIRRYWSPPQAEHSPPSYAASARIFGEILDDSVRLRMRSDVAVGLTLSGGLDSSAVLQAAVSATASTTDRLHAFTSVYQSSTAAKTVDERQWAAIAAQPYDRVDLELVPAGVSDWLDVLKRIVWHMDGPGYSPAVFPLWTIMRQARASNVPVILEGQGADELLGGYPQYAALALWSALSQPKPVAFLRSFQGYARTFSISNLAMWMVRERLTFAMPVYRRMVGALGTMDPEFVRSVTKDSSARPPRAINDRLLLDMSRDILPALLQYGDAVSMAHSVEVRLPFLDYRLVEFVSALPATFKVQNGETKRLLRTRLRTVGMQAIADRRDKQGYPTPTDSWLRSNDGEVLRSILLSPSAAIRAYCLPGSLRRLIDRHAAGHGGSGNHLYRLLTTELWLQSSILGRQV